MVDHEALLPTSAIPEDLRAYSSWHHPTRDIQLLIRAEIVKTLSAQSLRLAKNTPPSELGGLLWGQLLPTRDGATALFLMPEFVSSESQFFNTNDKDFQILTSALEHPTQKGLKLMGFFRSHLREGLCLSQQDEAFTRQFARDPDSVVLIIRPFEIGICMAGFFFWENGRLQTDVSDLEVPFVPSEDNISLNEPTNHPQPSSPPEGGAEPIQTSPKLSSKSGWSGTAPFPHVEHSLPQKPARKSVNTPPPSPTVVQSYPGNRNNSAWKPVLSIAILVMVSLAFYFAVTRRALYLLPATAPVTKTEVGLQAKLESNGQIDLSWDQTAPDLQRAQGAKLSIIDGTLHRELNMDKDQLRFGKLAYLPNSDDVQFYLEVHLDPAHSIAESVRVLPKLASTSAVMQEKSSEPVRAQTSLRHAVTTSSVFSSASEKTIESAPPTPRTSSQLAAADVVKHYPFQLVTGSSTPRVVFPSPSRPISPPPAVDTTSSVTVDSMKDIRLAPVPLPPPLQTKSQNALPATPAYVPARPIKQILPTIPSGTSTNLYQVTSVTLELEIDERGQVTGVHVVHGAPGLNAVLNMQAVAAAKQWKFQPATLHGKNVRSDHTIVFRFRPGQ